MQARGYNPGALDDVYGYDTKLALIEFQKANNLLEGYLDYETVNALGVYLPVPTSTNTDVASTGTTGNNNSLTGTGGISGTSPTSYDNNNSKANTCLLYTSPSPRDATLSRMPSSA